MFLQLLYVGKLISDVLNIFLERFLSLIILYFTEYFATFKGLADDFSWALVVHVLPGHGVVHLGAHVQQRQDADPLCVLRVASEIHKNR